MKKSVLILAATALCAGLASPAWSASEAAPKGAAQAAAAVLTSGEVRSVDTAQAKVTIKHQDIKNLDMPAMTMVFRATRPELLKGLKAGDRIRFHAEMDKGALVVTHIEAAR